MNHFCGFLNSWKKVQKNPTLDLSLDNLMFWTFQIDFLTENFN